MCGKRMEVGSDFQLLVVSPNNTLKVPTELMSYLSNENVSPKLLRGPLCINVGILILDLGISK